MKFEEILNKTDKIGYVYTREPM